MRGLESQIDSKVLCCGKMESISVHANNWLVNNYVPYSVTIKAMRLGALFLPSSFRGLGKMWEDTTTFLCETILRRTLSKEVGVNPKKSTTDVIAIECVLARFSARKPDAEVCFVRNRDS